MFAVAHSSANDRQIRFEVQLEHPQRLFDIGCGCSNRHQGQDHVALFDVIFDPLFVDGDVAFKKVKAWVGQ